MQNTDRLFTLLNRKLVEVLAVLFEPDGSICISRSADEVVAKRSDLLYVKARFHRPEGRIKLRAKSCNHRLALSPSAGFEIRSHPLAAQRQAFLKSFMPAAFSNSAQINASLCRRK